MGLTKKIIGIFVFISIIVTACVPITPAQEFSLPTVNSNVDHLNILLDKVHLDIQGGDQLFLTGYVETNQPELHPTFVQEDSWLRLEQAVISETPALQKKTTINNWKIILDEGPYAIDLQSEGIEGSIDLSGIALSDVEIRERNSHYNLNLSEPNPIAMSSFRVLSKSGRDVRLAGLGNLNTPVLVFESIAGFYTLDFSGDLQQAMAVDIKFALGDLRLEIPESTYAVVTLNGNYQRITSTGNWEVNDNVARNQVEGPLLSIVIEMDVGALTLVLI